MKEKFSWRGMKIGLLGPLFIGLSLLIRSEDKGVNQFLNLLMLIGILIIFVGLFFHYKDVFKNKQKNGD